MPDIEVHEEVVRWLDALAPDDWKRAVVVIDRLAQLGSANRMPHAKPLGEGLFELRFSLAGTARRITYRFTSDGRAVLLTTFRKQRQNEATEIARARRAARECTYDHDHDHDHDRG